MVKQTTRCLLKSEICKALGLPSPSQDEKYTALRYATETIEGCAAIISDLTSRPEYITPDKRCESLADIAMKKGAAVLISTRQLKDYPCLIVDDVFEAHSRIILSCRKRFSPKTIAVTGSIGKTTATAMVKAVVEQRFDTLCNVGNANTPRSAGKMIQQLTDSHQMYVQETMEGPPYGAAATVSKLVLPQAAIITAVGTSHMDAFGSQQRILESCLGVQEGMPKDGLLILNADDPFQYQAKPARKAVYYGIDNPNADYRAVNIRLKDACLFFDILHNGATTPAKLNCIGKHNVLNALAAFVAGKWAGMSDAEVVAGLATFRATGIRQNLVQYGDYRIYLDCYNAAVESMGSALDVLDSLSVCDGGKRIAVLADIKETGQKDDEIHRSVGRLVAKSSADILICYGASARLIAEETRAAKDIPVYQTEDEKELEQILRCNITPKDVTLFKGSRGMALERFVDRVFGTWFYESDEEANEKSYIKSDGQLQYRVYPDHAVVIAKVTSGEKVEIPESFLGVPVTGINQDVFKNSKTYTRTVYLPTTLKNIRNSAFSYVSRMETITIPSSVKLLGDNVFRLCAKLKSVVINDGCIHIGNRTFSDCKLLEQVVIPPSVRQIGDEAFFNCEAVTIYGEKGSYAENYAKKCGIAFAAVR